MVDNDLDDAAESALVAIGKRLAKAREGAGLDLKAIATELHLRVEVIQAIEAGDEAALPAAAFVRGYVRSYARCVGLDDVALVAGLPQAVEHRPVPRQGLRKSYRVPSFPLGRVLVWGLVVSLLVAVVMFGLPAVERLWSGQQSEPSDNSLQLPRSEFEASDADDVLVLPANGSEEISPLPETPVEPSEPEATVEPSEDDESASAESAIPLPAPEKEAVIAPASDTADSAGPAELTLRFTQDSWVEMTSRDRKLVVGTQRAGTERTVRAEPPIDILLGNAPAVEMHWRGKRFDITPYQRGKVARIKLEH